MIKKPSNNIMLAISRISDIEMRMGLKTVLPIELTGRSKQ